MPVHEVRIALPDWARALVPWDRPHPTTDGRMGLAIELARVNVTRGAGGPFGAVVFDLATGLPVSAGVNQVEAGKSAVLHAEIVALLLAQADLGRYTLHAEDLPQYALVTSCDPCAMCLGATLWSGIRNLECGASRDDATRIGFEEGPVFPASFAYLTDRGVRVRHGIRRAEAAGVLQEYRDRGGLIYNG